LPGELTILLNSADPITLGTDGSFSFPNPLPPGSVYTLGITSPPGFLCTVPRCLPPTFKSAAPSAA
jgi:hypothetical protein